MATRHPYQRPQIKSREPIAGMLADGVGSATDNDTDDT